MTLAVERPAWPRPPPPDDRQQYRRGPRRELVADRPSREQLLARWLARSPTRARAASADPRRGMTKLLDWLERQPGDTWQERWLASGAEAPARWVDPAVDCRVTRVRPVITATSCAAGWRCWSPGRSSGLATRGCCGSARR